MVKEQFSMAITDNKKKATVYTCQNQPAISWFGRRNGVSHLKHKNCEKQLQCLIRKWIHSVKF